MKKRILLIFAVYVVAILFSLNIGAVKISLSDVFQIITGGDVPEYMRIIFFNIRLPRIIMAILIGMMLSSSGVVVQTVFQNPLADPYIIGISASATFGAVLAYVLKLPDIYYGVFAFITSLISAFLIFSFSKSKNGMNTGGLLIIGIAISSLLGAFTSFSIYMIGEDSFKITMWTMGYLGNASWSKVLFLFIPLLISVIYFLYRCFEMDCLLSGEEEAHSMGVNVEKIKKQLLIVASLIVAYSVAFSGMIGFVGLIIPHTLRMILGHSNKKLIPYSIVVGGIFLMLCDTLARNILRPVEIPIGTITAFFGAPFFLFLAVKNKKEF